METQAMGKKGDKARATRIPAGRLERLMRFGAIAGGVALGMVGESARRLANGEPQSFGDYTLSPENAEQIVYHLSRMRGAAMKLGQVLSLEADITLPPAFADILATLQDSGDTMPVSQLRSVLKSEYGRKWEKKFLSFDEEPVAAASIGQVHRAVAKDGRELALKVQFPGVAKSIDSDVDNLAALLKLARVLPDGVDFTPHIAEVKRQLRHETDYLAEADSLRRYRKLVKSDPLLVVPRVHKKLTTKRILAMDYVHARPVGDLWENDTPQRVRNAVGDAMQRLVLRELFEFGFMQTDPNFANFMYSETDGALVLLDFGSTIEITPETQTLYRRLLEHAVPEDKAGLRNLALEAGWLSGKEPRVRVDALLELLFLCCEPLRTKGKYDFGKTDLAERVRDAGFDLTFRQGHVRPPSPEMIFINRKLGGTYLLCARLGARVNARRLLRESLAEMSA